MKSRGRFYSIYLLWLIIIIASLVNRTALLAMSWQHIDFSLPLLVKIYAVGFFYDCVTFSYFSIPFVLAAVLLPDKFFNSSFFRGVAQITAFIISYLMLFNLVSEYTFFDEFATRYNFIAVDYLIYTNEVIRNIRESYPVNSILAVLLLLNIFIYLPLRKHLTRSFGVRSDFVRRVKIGAILLLLPLLSLAAVDLSFTRISANNYAVELAGNGIYSLFAAFRNNELDFNKFYVSRDDKLLLKRLKDLVAEKNSRFKNPAEMSLTRIIEPVGEEKRYNVVLVIEESMSADYMAAFGNKNRITPNLDRLAAESLFFTHLYATGTRTVRGLEALTLGIPPLPGTSIVKRPNNEGFVSLGSIMKGKGYDNKFIYAGHGYFDNMNHFFASNGFRTIDRTDFAADEVTFTNAWGVCDEDLMMKAVKEADISHAANKPFFSVVMTTSNHRPYSYPEGKIDIPSKTGRDGAVKYADYSIGRLIEESKKRGWFKDTIFVIVADHCASSAGKIGLPVKRYEIPMLIYAPAVIKPGQIDRMMSQIDVPPTLLGLLNMKYESSFVGKDILSAESWKERAFISTYQNIGVIQGDKLVVLGPKKQVDYYKFDRKDGNTTALKPQEDLLLDSLAYLQGTNYIYKNRLNRLKQP